MGTYGERERDMYIYGYIYTHTYVMGDAEENGSYYLGVRV